MGVDYIIGYECEIKKDLGSERIVSLCKQKSQAEAVLEISRQKGDNRPPSEITVGRFVETPEGKVQEDVNLQEMLDEAKGLDTYAPKCAGCPANSQDRPFGCYGYITYPITDEQETWIMNRLPDDLEGLRGKFLCKAIADFGYDGGGIPDLRRRGAVFYERNRPVRRKWGGFFSGTRITSDQILQMMFGLGDLDPGHGMVLCMTLGMVKDDVTPVDVIAAGQEASKRSDMLQPLEGDATMSPSVDQIRRFLNAARVSAILEVPLVIDA